MRLRYCPHHWCRMPLLKAGRRGKDHVLYCYYCREHYIEWSRKNMEMRLSNGKHLIVCTECGNRMKVDTMNGRCQMCNNRKLFGGKKGANIDFLRRPTQPLRLSFGERVSNELNSWMKTDVFYEVEWDKPLDIGGQRFSCCHVPCYVLFMPRGDGGIPVYIMCIFCGKVYRVDAEDFPAEEDTIDDFFLFEPQPKKGRRRKSGGKK